MRQIQGAIGRQDETNIGMQYVDQMRKIYGAIGGQDETNIWCNRQKKLNKQKAQKIYKMK